MSGNTYKTHADSHRKRSRAGIWVAIGALFLIVLLILWLTFAELTYNTDVAASVAPHYTGIQVT